MLAGEADPALPNSGRDALPGSLPDERPIKKAATGQRHAAGSQTAAGGTLRDKAKGQPLRREMRGLAAREGLFSSGSPGTATRARTKAETQAGREEGGATHQAEERGLPGAELNGPGPGERTETLDAGGDAPAPPPPAAPALGSSQQSELSRKRILRSSGVRLMEDAVPSQAPVSFDNGLYQTIMLWARRGTLPESALNAAVTRQPNAAPVQAVAGQAREAEGGRTRTSGAAEAIQPGALEPATPQAYKPGDKGTTPKQAKAAGKDAARGSSGATGGLPRAGELSTASGSVQGVGQLSKASPGSAATTRTSTKTSADGRALASGAPSRTRAGTQGKPAQSSPLQPKQEGSLAASSTSAKRATRKVSIDFRALAALRMRASAVTADEAMAKVVRRKKDDNADDPSGACACSTPQEAPVEDHGPESGSFSPDRRTGAPDAGRDPLGGAEDPEGAGDSEGSTPSPPRTLTGPCSAAPCVSTPEQRFPQSISGEPCRSSQGGRAAFSGGTAAPSDNAAQLSEVAQQCTGGQGPAVAFISGASSPTRDEDVHTRGAAIAPAGGGNSSSSRGYEGLEPARNVPEQVAAERDCATPKEMPEREASRTRSESGDVDIEDVAPSVNNEAESADLGLRPPPAPGLPESGAIPGRDSGLNTAVALLAASAGPDAATSAAPEPLYLDKDQEFSTSVAQDASVVDTRRQALSQAPSDWLEGGQGGGHALGEDATPGSANAEGPSEGPNPDAGPLAHRPVVQAGGAPLEAESSGATTGSACGRGPSPGAGACAVRVGPHPPQPAAYLQMLHGTDPLPAGHPSTLQQQGAGESGQLGTTKAGPTMPGGRLKRKAETLSLHMTELLPLQTEQVLKHRAVHGSRTARRRSRLRLSLLTAQTRCRATSSAIRKWRDASSPAGKSLASSADFGGAGTAFQTDSAGGLAEEGLGTSQHAAGETPGGALRFVQPCCTLVTPTKANVAAGGLLQPSDTGSPPKTQRRGKRPVSRQSLLSVS